MSKKQSATSKEGREEKTTVSVYDFIYHDAPRIASFLAQFDNSGHLTQILQVGRISRVRDEEDRTKGNLGILSGEMKRSAADHYGKESQRVYDPMWTNALALLDYLDEAGRIQRDIGNAQIGQFVLSSGTLTISDLQLMEQTWRLETVKSMMLNGIAGQVPEIPKAQRNNPELLAAKRVVEQQIKAVRDGANLFFDLIKILPHTIQARMVGQAPIWCSLGREGMTFDASDIVLKYGTQIPGEWHCLGILDALPEQNSLLQSEETDWGQGEEMAAKMMGIIAPITRNLLGRPANYFGITPLLIFRVVED